jgi:hypothetical protein
MDPIFDRCGCPMRFRKFYYFRFQIIYILYIYISIFHDIYKPRIIYKHWYTYQGWGGMLMFPGLCRLVVIFGRNPDEVQARSRRNQKLFKSHYLFFQDIAYFYYFLTARSTLYHPSLANCPRTTEYYLII